MIETWVIASTIALIGLVLGLLDLRRHVTALRTGLRIPTPGQSRADAAEIAALGHDDPRVRPPEVQLRRARPGPRPTGPMPASGSKEWRVVSAELLAELDPGRLQVSGEDRESLRPGDHVCLIFLATNEPGAPYGEKLWCTVARAAADGTYVGELNERPSRVPLAIGAEVHFGPEHVDDLKWREDDPDDDADDAPEAA